MRFRFTSTNILFDIPQNSGQLIEIIQIVNIGASSSLFDTISLAEAISIFNSDNINIFIVQINQTRHIGCHNNGGRIGFNLGCIRDTTAAIKWQGFTLAKKITHGE